MPNFSSFASYAKAMDQVEKDLNAEGRRKVTHAQGEKAQEIAAKFAMRDLGSDQAFSGWRRNDRIKAATQLKDGRDGATLMTPTGTSAGIWTTVTDGRNGDGGVGLFQGPGVNLRTGRTTRTKSGDIRIASRRQRKAKRPNGRTSGKGTADDARAAMQRELPKIADDGVRVIFTKHFDVT